MSGDINNFSYWESLPELEIPIINDINQQGKIYDIEDFGVLIVNKNECTRELISKVDESKVKIPLPVTLVKQKNRNKKFRLPIDMTSWVLNNIKPATNKKNKLPNRVEMGNINGRIFVEIVCKK